MNQTHILLKQIYIKIKVMKIPMKEIFMLLVKMESVKKYGAYYHKISTKHKPINLYAGRKTATSSVMSR